MPSNPARAEISSEVLQTLRVSKKFAAWRPSSAQPSTKRNGYGRGKDFTSVGRRHENYVDPKRPFEKHYSPAEVAKLWGISVDLARDLFRSEDDVLKLERTGSKKYVTLRIPESVLLRVHTRMSKA
jgi:hypothetical protein